MMGNWLSFQMGHQMATKTQACPSTGRAKNKACVRDTSRGMQALTKEARMTRSRRRVTLPIGGVRTNRFPSNAASDKDQWHHRSTGVHQTHMRLALPLYAMEKRVRQYAMQRHGA